MTFRPRPGHWAAAAAVLLASASAQAGSITTIDLTQPGSTGTSQGALFYQADPKPTGTGVLNPFLRIQQTGTERGYNTDGQIEFETKDTNDWTRSLQLGSLAAVTVGTTQYYKFILDINESANGTNSLLSMNDFRIYLGNGPSLTGWNDGFGTNSVKVYDIDAVKNTTVNLDYALNSGSGSGDLFVYVPVTLFAQLTSQSQYANFQYVYLYSGFGSPYGSNAGFEEWASVNKTSTTPTTAAVPAPPGVVLAGLGLVCCLSGRAFRRKAVTPVAAA